MIKVLIAILAVLLGGWLLMDGAKALTKGDYTTARSGAYAGQLGPWSKVVSAAGINPRSTPVKVLHIALGFFWIVGGVACFLRLSAGRGIIMATSVCSLWYMPFGTVIAIIEITLLFLTVRKAKLKNV